MSNDNKNSHSINNSNSKSNSNSNSNIQHDCITVGNRKRSKVGLGRCAYTSLSFIPCYCLITLLHHQSQVSVTNAFSPVGSELMMNKNKKCRQGGSKCHRSSDTARTSSSLPSTSSSSGGIRNDNFSVRMAKYDFDQEQQLQLQPQQQRQQQKYDEMERDTKIEIDQDEPQSESTTLERRLFIASLFATTTATATSGLLNPPNANAFEKAYPVNLDFDNDDSTINLQSIRQERIAVKKSQTKQTKDEIISQPLIVRSKTDIISSVVWGGALWLLSGSRSNPLVKPLANVVYDENTEAGSWVKDRNDGLFTELPIVFSIILGVVFLALGFITDRGLLLLAEGESNVVLQLAGVSLIGGASLELGRIASGEKMITREDLDREVMLANEFSEFAGRRLIVGQGGSIHKTEVIRAFRRFFAKYRVENDQYPLTDLEIERLLRTWNKSTVNEEGLSSAGFLKGVKINEQAVIQ